MRHRVLTVSCALVMAALLFGCAAKTVVTRVPSPRANDDNEASSKLKMNGVFYTLPRTVIETKVPIKRIERDPGKYKDFAKCFFPDEVNTPRFVKEKAVSYKVEEPKFSSRGEPDPQQVFMIKIPGHYLEDKTIALDLTPSGVMTRGEITATDHSLEFAINSVKTFVPILSNLGIFTSSAAGIPKEVFEDLEKCFNDNGYGGTLLKEAKQAYTALLKFQQARDGLISGGINNTPRETLELILKEIDRRIAGLKGLFLGNIKEDTWTAIFDFAPDTQMKQKILFQYVPKGMNSGICKTNYSGINKINSDFEAGADCQNPTKVWIRITVGHRRLPGREIAQVVSDADLRQSGERGFYYRIPATATVAIVEEGGAAATATESSGQNGAQQQATDVASNELGHEAIPVAQLGAIVSLPASSNGRTTKYQLALYEATGAMKNFSLGSDALIQSSQVGDVGTAVSSIVEARNKQRAAEAAAADELNQLERKRKILEEMVKIKEAEEALKKPTP